MNVNDLNRTDNQRVVITQPGVTPNNATQNISISAVQQENAPISINASNGAGVAEADNGNRPVIRINPNRKKGHRSVAANEPIETVNPDDYVQTTTKKIDPKFFNELFSKQEVKDIFYSKQLNKTLWTILRGTVMDAFNRHSLKPVILPFVL